jgi:flagellar basal body rod protein FlgB
MSVFTTPTIELLARAIDTAALRQGVYSSNVANAGVEGYRRLEVALDSAASTAGLAPTPTIVPTDSVVKLDEEMARMAKNALRYDVLVGAFEKSFGTLRLAVREGRD